MDFSLRDANWKTDCEALGQVRRRVFIEEQHVPEELEWDEFDATSYHVLAVDDRGRPIGCGRLKADGQIGRMAVIRDWRNRGTGTAILNRLLEQARTQRLDSVYLHAQVTAIPFYERHGFRVSSDTFTDAGIPHRTMSRSLEYL